MTAHNIRLTLQKLSRSAFLLTQSCGVGMSRPRGKRSGSRRVPYVPTSITEESTLLNSIPSLYSRSTLMLEDSIMIIRGSVSHILPRFPLSGGYDSSLCEALLVQIDISRLDSVSRLGVFMHCLVFPQVLPPSLCSAEYEARTRAHCCRQETHHRAKFTAPPRRPGT